MGTFLFLPITTSGQPTEPQLADIHALGVRHIGFFRFEFADIMRINVDEFLTMASKRLIFW